eukprot:Sspe_Gene.916::Locus_310_Transcript_1_4_Confidence_0.429_Length_1878::g.916::m.916/K08857/NEK1_4_5; NIMA (never in mitosis gene a)-related kinase 1/4/5
MSRSDRETPPDHAKRMFARIDTNGSGRINVAELSRAMADPSISQGLKWNGTAEELVMLLGQGQPGFSSERLCHYFKVRYLFDLIDANGSGRINEWELETALRTNHRVQELIQVPAKLSKSLFRQIDTNGSGAISFVEFYRYYTATPLSKPYKPVKDHQACIEALFAKIDLDNNGNICLEEFQKALRNDPEVQLELGWTQAMAKNLFRIVDKDKNGLVTLEEFRHFCRAQWLFNAIDNNRSGYIDSYELGAALEDPSMQQELQVKLSDAQMAFAEIDTDGSNAVTFSEFFFWLANRPKRPTSPPMGRVSPPPPKVVEIPKGPDQYETVKMLGEGTFGQVFLCRRKTDKLNLIMKKPKLGAVTMEEVQAESDMLHRLKHRNIVRFVDAFWEGSGSRRALVIITEFCDGGDLRSLLPIDRPSPIPSSTIKNLFSQVLDGIRYLHDRNIIHRDLKPENIFLTKGANHVKIGDLGLAKQTKYSNRIAAHTQCGTMVYMAPELHSGQPYGPPNDIWALGCILYEMGSGELAFTNVANIVHCKVPTKGPFWLAPLINKVLQADPLTRPDITAFQREFAAASPHPRGGYSGARE